MTCLRFPALLLAAITACDRDAPILEPDGGPPDSGAPPTLHLRGPHEISAVEAEPGADRAWLFHSSIADVNATPQVTTAHLGLYEPKYSNFIDVLDTTGTQGKRILFPGRDKVLYVGRRGSDDVFVTIDAVARRPLAQRSHPGDRDNFRISPSGRAVLSTNRVDGMLHVLDTASLTDQVVPGVRNPDALAWAPAEDLLFTLEPDSDSTVLMRRDLRTADLTQPVPPPAPVARLTGGAALTMVISLDDRFAAIAMLSQPDDMIALVDLTTGAIAKVVGSLTPAFTNDHRALVWRPTSRTGSSYELRAVDPATGVASPPLVSNLFVPQLRVLRHQDAVLLGSLQIDAPAYLVRIPDGTRTELPRAALSLLKFERPGHPEVWLWGELGGALFRCDLTTGTITTIGSLLHSIAPRPAADDVIIAAPNFNTFRFELRQLSLATGQNLNPPAVVENPNDLSAPHRLAPF